MFKRAELFTHHAIRREALSVRQRMGELLQTLGGRQFVEFSSLFRVEEGRLGIVVTFLSLLELAKELLIEIVQDAPLAPVFVRSLSADSDAEIDAAEPVLNPHLPADEAVFATHDEPEPDPSPLSRSEG